MSCQSVSVRPLRAISVSIATVASVSPCAGTEVRWIASVSSAHRPRTYSFEVVPSSALPCTETCTHVPAGVSAFQDETSSV